LSVGYTLQKQKKKTILADALRLAIQSGYLLSLNAPMQLRIDNHNTSSNNNNSSSSSSSSNSNRNRTLAAAAAAAAATTTLTKSKAMKKEVYMATSERSRPSIDCICVH